MIKDRKLLLICKKNYWVNKKYISIQTFFNYK